LKKSLAVMGLIGLLTANAQAADLFGSLKKASETIDKAQAKVTETQNKVEEASAAASNVATTHEASTLALVKAKLGDNATKAQVKNVLGAPVAINGEKAAEVWVYDANSVNATAAQAAQVAAAFDVNTLGATKQVAVHFAGDIVNNIVINESAE